VQLARLGLVGAINHKCFRLNLATGLREDPSNTTPTKIAALNDYSVNLAGLGQ